MKRVGFSNAGLLGLSLVGLISIINPTMGVSAEEKVVAHEGVIQPTRALMNDIAKRMNNILDGILAGSLKYVAQEAGAIVDQSYKINETFFPVDPKENKWFKRAKIDPNDSEKITRLKEKFDVYLKGIVSSALEVQKTAKTNEQKATFKAFTNMIEKSCFECHEDIRDTMIPVENR